MFYSQTSRLILLFLGLAALILAGCGGGGDDNSVERDLQEQVDMLEADLAAAQQAQMEAETAQAAAETAQTAAVAAQATAEMERDTANTATGVAEEMARTARQARTAAETAQAAAEAAEVAAETAQATLQAMLNQANVDLAITEAAKTAAVTAQATAEAARTQAEQRATAAETAKAQAEAAKTIAEAAEAAAKTAQKEAEDRATDAEKRAIEAEEAERVAKEALADAEDNTDDAEEVARLAQQQANQRIQSQEANQRAQNLKEAFERGELAGTLTTPLDLDNFDSPVDITAPTRGRLTLERGGHRTATLSGSGRRSATLTLTSGGDTGKTVVYTDRELTRPLLDHYGEFKDPDAPQFNAQNGGAGLITTTTTDVTEITGVSVTHRLRSSLSGTTLTANGAIVTDSDVGASEERSLTITDDSFSGSVHGVSGQFRCDGAAGCMITVTGTYHNNVDSSSTATENRLDTVTMSLDGGMLYFRPSSATASVSLCGDSARCTAGDDEEYMMFGWWREDPSSAAGDYDFGIFAEVEGTPPTGVTATYDGDAVGMYVEQDPNNAVDTHRQGEFTADVFLRADDGDVSGTIGDFVTRPTGGSSAPRTADRWLVRLNQNNSAIIDNLAGVKSGYWARAFVPPHDNAATGTEPPAVVGAFNTRIDAFLHLVGSFGANKR